MQLPDTLYPANRTTPQFCPSQKQRGETLACKENTARLKYLQASLIITSAPLSRREPHTPPYRKKNCSPPRPSGTRRAAVPPRTALDSHGTRAGATPFCKKNRARAGGALRNQASQPLPNSLFEGHLSLARLNMPEPARCRGFSVLLSPRNPRSCSQVRIARSPYHHVSSKA